MEVARRGKTSATRHDRGRTAPRRHAGVAPFGLPDGIRSVPTAISPPAGSVDRSRDAPVCCGVGLAEFAQ